MTRRYSPAWALLGVLCALLLLGGCRRRIPWPQHCTTAAVEPGPTGTPAFTRTYCR